MRDRRGHVPSRMTDGERGALLTPAAFARAPACCTFVNKPPESLAPQAPLPGLVSPRHQLRAGDTSSAAPPPGPGHGPRPGIPCLRKRWLEPFPVLLSVEQISEGGPGG